ncbi:TPA: YebC/PmpR family DNA-binding transcriptional regulator [Patescibacteria group bacterium]|jgi:YebC/PmpR family DNA-binding regulatory protein|nr:YebC/PmpR family DNA-binding transcriptional regulator [Patescibacteria group bacterium]
MSGHSKWSTIKRAKGAADAKRAALFAKLSKKISIAAREGGSGDISHNFKLRVEVEKARAQSMPNDNIDRAIKKGMGQSGGPAIEEIIYEGYGPFGVALIIEAASDNRNRTVQSIKHTLTKAGGSLGAQGSTAWLFETVGQIMVENSGKDMSELQLIAIEGGAKDIEESKEGLVITTTPDGLDSITKQLKAVGAAVVSSEVIRKCTQPVELTSEQTEKIENLIEQLEDDEDVVSVFTSIN